jgi:hypothetical protein
MIKEINKFFNDRPVLGVILIILLLLAVYYISQNSSSSEHMGQIPLLPKCTINDDQQFNAQYVLQAKNINFKCNVKGIDYYLACVKMSDYVANNPNKTPDCAQSMLILVPATEIQTMLDNYMKDMNTAEKICNASMKIRCQESAQSDDAKSKCLDSYDNCKQTRLFLHDFTVVDITPPNSDSSTVLRKYIIKGTAIPSMNGQSFPTMFNTFLLNEQGINMVCGDTYAYGAPNIPKQYAEVIITEKSTGNAGGVVSADPTLTVKIRFNALQQIISTTNGVTKRTPIVDQCTGEQKIKPTYLGICGDSQTCSKGTNVYPRVCVYDDIMNPNVLDFSPYVVNV